jgi:hypothetical protein
VFLPVSKTFRGIAAFGVAWLLLTGCDSGYDQTSPTADQLSAHLKVNVGVRRVGALSKSSTIVLNKLAILLVSSQNDTVLDVLTPSTTPALNPSPSTEQTLTKSYDLAPQRSWKLKAVTVDSRDSIVHADSVNIPFLNEGDNAEASLNLASRYSMYTARFLNIPDSIGTTTSGTVKVPLNINRLVLMVDGVIVADSSRSYFTPKSTVDLKFDYVTTGTAHTIRLLAYGPFKNWDATKPLFDGSAVYTATPGLDGSVSVTLYWVGPTSASGSMTVLVGKVGQVTVNGTFAPQ